MSWQIGPFVVMKADEKFRLDGQFIAIERERDNLQFKLDAASRKIDELERQLAEFRVTRSRLGDAYDEASDLLRKLNNVVSGEHGSIADLLGEV